jgi:hypothetical protein
VNDTSSIFFLKYAITSFGQKEKKRKENVISAGFNFGI